MSGAPFRLAHLTDPHLAPLPAFPKRALLSRRILGYLSWLRYRQRRHLRQLLDLVTSDLALQAVDHIVVTGDLVNLALPGEFAEGAVWLGGLGDARDVTYVPGNHDAYVPIRWHGSWSHIGPFMRDDDGPADAGMPARFPFVRRRGRMALVGVSTASPNVPTMAMGLVGGAQLRRLREILEGLRAPGCCRVLLLHHPPVPGMTSWRRHLKDAGALRAVLREVGAELLLCGHEHRFQFGQVDGPDGPIPVLGGPSASLHVDNPARFGGYLIHSLAPAGPGWRIEVEVRRLDPARLACRGEPIRRVAPRADDGRLELVPVVPVGAAGALPTVPV
jgi:3',5'-cyclic AMP phosphodiesterase CpdA